VNLFGRSDRVRASCQRVRDPPRTHNARICIRLRAVTSISEMLTAEDREAISGAFGVPVISMFVSTEGLAGHSEPGGAVSAFASDDPLPRLHLRQVRDGLAPKRPGCGYCIQHPPRPG